MKNNKANLKKADECKDCSNSCPCQIHKSKKMEQLSELLDHKELFSLDSLIKSNQRLMQLKQQDDQQEFMINMMKEKIKDVKTGKVHGPFFIQMGRNIFAPEPDVKKFLKNMLMQMNLIKTSNDQLKVQIKSVQHEFNKSVVLLTELLGKRAGSIELPPEPKVILPTKPIDELTAKDKAMINQAIQHNTKRKRANRK